MTDADYSDDLALLTNTPAQVESQLHSPEQAAGGISLYVNVDKTELMCFRQDRTTSPLRDKPLKLVDQFTYLDSNISSTESDHKIQNEKAWTAIDRLSNIQESSVSDKIKQDFFQAAAMSYYCMDALPGLI